MNNDIPTVPGTPFAGGFYAGLISIGSRMHVLIVAPKAGETNGIWNEAKHNITDAQSYADGLANTKAMAAGGSLLAQWALDLKINDFSDWYLPSRDELELMYRSLKPTEGNCCSFRDGDNPSSLPVGYPYTPDMPAKTAATAFQEGGEESFKPEWYWSSTQNAAYDSCAWVQDFGDGDQSNYRKFNEYAARAVRRLEI